MTAYDQRGQTVDTQINTDTVHFGITIEDHEKALKRREQEVIEHLSQTAPSDRLMREVLEKEYNAVIAKLNDLKESYQAELASCAEVEKTLQEIKDNLPESQAEAALEKFNEGDKEAAKVLFDHVIDKAEKTNELAGKAAYENGQMAEQEIRYLEAKEYYQKAIRFQPENSTFNNALGFILHVLGQYDKAIEYYQLALSSDLKTYGEDHLKVAISRNDLGMTYQALGQYDNAIEHFSLAIVYSARNVDENRSAILEYCINLVGAWSDKGYSEFAVQYLEEMLSKWLSGVDEQHPLLASIYRNLGIAWYNRGGYDQAVACHERALKIDLTYYEGDHPKVAIDYGNLGVSLKAKGELDRAVLCHEKALTIDLAVYDESHPEVAKNLNNLGGAWRAKGDTDKALEYLESALKMDIKNLGEEHPNVLKKHNNMGIILFEQGKYEQAEGHFKCALGRHKSDLFEDVEPNLRAEILKNLGIIQIKTGEIESGITCLKDAVSFLVKAGLDNRQYQLQLVNALYLSKKYQDSIDQLKVMFKRDIKTLDRSDPRIAEDYRLLAKCYLAINDFDRVNMYVKKALSSRFENTVTGSHQVAIRMWKDVGGSPSEQDMQRIGGLLFFDDANIVVPTYSNTKQSQHVNRQSTIRVPRMVRYDLSETGPQSYLYKTVHLGAKFLYSSDVARLQKWSKYIDSGFFVEAEVQKMEEYRFKLLLEMKTKNYHGLALLFLFGICVVSVFVSIVI